MAEGECRRSPACHGSLISPGRPRAGRGDRGSQRRPRHRHGARRGRPTPPCAPLHSERSTAWASSAPARSTDAMADPEVVVRRRACGLAGRGLASGKASPEVIDALSAILTSDHDASVVECAAWAWERPARTVARRRSRHSSTWRGPTPIRCVAKQRWPPSAPSETRPRWTASSAALQDKCRGETPRHHRTGSVRRSTRRRSAATVPRGPGLAGSTSGRGPAGRLDAGAGRFAPSVRRRRRRTAGAACRRTRGTGPHPTPRTPGACPPGARAPLSHWRGAEPCPAAMPRPRPDGCPGR